MNNSFIYKVLLALSVYFAPISSLIHVVLLFILLDFLTGMYASFKTKQKIISSRLRKTIEKFVCYSLAIIVAHIFQTEIMPWLNFTQLVAGFIAAVELLSIAENIKLITGLDLVKRFRDYIMSQFKKKIDIDQLTDKTDDDKS